MALQPINLGSAPNDGTGDPLRDGGTKINANFVDLDQRVNGKEATGTAAAAVSAHDADADAHPALRDRLGGLSLVRVADQAAWEALGAARDPDTLYVWPTGGA
jgi:hypothetical protein